MIGKVGELFGRGDFRKGTHVETPIRFDKGQSGNFGETFFIPLVQGLEQLGESKLRVSTNNVVDDGRAQTDLVVLSWKIAAPDDHQVRVLLLERPG